MQAEQVLYTQETATYETLHAEFVMSVPDLLRKNGTDCCIFFCSRIFAVQYTMNMCMRWRRKRS